MSISTLHDEPHSALAQYAWDKQACRGSEDSYQLIATMDNGQCTPINTLENITTAAQNNFDVINEDISHHQSSKICQDVNCAFQCLGSTLWPGSRVLGTLARLASGLAFGLEAGVGSRGRFPFSEPPVPIYPMTPVTPNDNG